MKHESHSYLVIITVKNGESVIKKTLDSIISQSLKPSLVCIINDGSTDSTPDILLEIKKKTMTLSTSSIYQMRAMILGELYTIGTKRVSMLKI